MESRRFDLEDQQPNIPARCQEINGMCIPSKESHEAAHWRGISRCLAVLPDIMRHLASPAPSG
jgi:hypothetical protein